MITAYTDTTKLERNLDSLVEVAVGAGLDISDLIRDEAVRLNKTIVNFTPPISGKKGSGPKASGEMAIDAELHSLFKEAKEETILEVSYHHGYHDINTFIENKEGEKINLQWANIDPQGAAMAEYHRRNRDPRTGKIKREKASPKGIWKARVIVPFGTLDPYIKQVQKRVGRARASMAKFGAALGAKFPSWISRHFESVGDISIVRIEGLKNAESPSVEFGSRAPGIDRIGQRVSAAVNFRANVVAKRVRLILNGYAKDLNRGVPASKMSSKTAGAMEEVV